MTRTKSRLLTVEQQKVAASDAVLFGGPYNVLDGGEEVIRRYLPLACQDWTQDELQTATNAVVERAHKLAQQIINKYGR